MFNISLDKKMTHFSNIFGLEIAKDSIGYTILRDNIDSRYFKKLGVAKKVIGPFKCFTLMEGAVMVEFQNARLILSLVGDNLLRLSWNLDVNGGATKFDRIDLNESIISLLKGDLEIRVVVDGIEFLHKGTKIRKESLPEIGDVIKLKSEIREDSVICGTGERALPLNLRGSRVELWNHDANGSYGPGSDPLYINIPILVDIKNNFGYCIFYDNASKGTIDVCSKEENTLEVEFTGGNLDYYITFGTLDEMFSRMVDILGKPLLPPKWALGYHQSRYSYESQAEVEDIVRKFKEMNLPLSAVHLDIDYMDGYRVFTADTGKFPDLKGLSEILMKNGVRIVAILDPGVKWDDKFSIYNEGVEGGYFIKDPEGNVIKGPVWPGNAAFPDFSSKEAREWWASKYSFFANNGISGVWHDMNEPAIFVFWGDNTLPLSAVQNEGYHYLIHNKYGLHMSIAGYEGLSKIGNGERPFILSRSGWAGIQKYAFVWTGDTESTWRELRQTIPTILNLGMSGIPFSGVDIGGFSGNPSEELFLRWFQLGSMLPFFRNHSAKNTARREPWAYSENGQEVIKKFLKLRYLLIPYFYSVAYQSHSSGIPFIRVVPSRDGKRYLENAFFVGEYILVSPVLRRGLKKVRIMLPEGQWYYYWDDMPCEGDVDINVDIDDMPIFLRAGSIIPMDNNGLEFHVYPGNNDGFTFYDDDSRLNPRFIRIEFKMIEENGRLHINWKYEGDLLKPEDELKFVIHGRDKIVTVQSAIVTRSLFFGD